MVGLPCRGKSFFSNKLNNHYKELGLVCEIFNLGKIRRDLDQLTSKQKLDFFQKFDQ